MLASKLGTPSLQPPTLMKVREAPETEARGLAGRVGYVNGFTTPSKGVGPDDPDFVGTPTRDYAVHLQYLDFPGEGHWFPEELLEQVQYPAGYVYESPESMFRYVAKPDGSFRSELRNASPAQPSLLARLLALLGLGG